MKKYIQTKSILFILGFLFSIGISGYSQEVVVITPGGPDQTMPSATECETITLGSTRTLQRDVMTCDANLLITDETGDGAPYLISSAESLEYTFDSEQIYVFYCEADDDPLAPFPGGITFRATVCFNVVPVQAIPTLGEWGLLILLFSLMIFGIVMIKQSSTKPAFAK